MSTRLVWTERSVHDLKNLDVQAHDRIIKVTIPRLLVHGLRAPITGETVCDQVSGTDGFLLARDKVSLTSSGSRTTPSNPPPTSPPHPPIASPPSSTLLRRDGLPSDANTRPSRY